MALNDTSYIACGTEGCGHFWSSHRAFRDADTGELGAQTCAQCTCQEFVDPRPTLCPHCNSKIKRVTSYRQREMTQHTVGCPEQKFCQKLQSNGLVCGRPVAGELEDPHARHPEEATERLCGTHLKMQQDKIDTRNAGIWARDTPAWEETTIRELSAACALRMGFMAKPHRPKDDSGYYSGSYLTGNVIVPADKLLKLLEWYEVEVAEHGEDLGLQPASTDQLTTEA